MKLLNYTTSYFAGVLLLVIAIWATIFYFTMLDEIYDSIDDGLDNQKGLVIQKIAVDSTILKQSDFEEKDYRIGELTRHEALRVEDLYSDTSMYMQNEDDFEPVRILRTVFSRHGKFYELTLKTSMVEEDDLTRQLLLALLWLYAALVIVVLLLNNQLLKRIWRPFYQVLGQLNKFRVDRPVPDLSTSTRVEEFNELSRTAKRMMEVNSETFASQKQFIENASHELQTPLAISINKLESLAESAQLNEREAELLSSAIESLERMTRLNRSLLLLMRIENKQFHQVTGVNINKLMNKMVHDFQDQLKFRELSVEVAEQAACIVQMNEELAVILLANLMKNAIIHTHGDKPISVDLERERLTLRNAGEKSLDTNRMFTRFQPARSEQSTGLGLAIVRAICTLYNFEITYQFRENIHIMTIDFSGQKPIPNSFPNS